MWHLNSICVPQVDTWQAFGNSALAARQEGSGQTRVGKQEKNYRPLPAAHLIPKAHILSSPHLYILITRLSFCRTKNRWKVIHNDYFLSQEPCSLCTPRHVATFQHFLMVWLIGLSLGGRDSQIVEEAPMNFGGSLKLAHLIDLPEKEVSQFHHYNDRRTITNYAEFSQVKTTRYIERLWWFAQDYEVNQWANLW